MIGSGILFALAAGLTFAAVGFSAKTWQTGDTLSAADLNRLEQGVAANHGLTHFHKLEKQIGVDSSGDIQSYFDGWNGNWDWMNIGSGEPFYIDFSVAKDEAMIQSSALITTKSSGGTDLRFSLNLENKDTGEIWQLSGSHIEGDTQNHWQTPLFGMEKVSKGNYRLGVKTSSSSNSVVLGGTNNIKIAVLR